MVLPDLWYVVGVLFCSTGVTSSSALGGPWQWHPPLPLHSASPFFLHVTHSTNSFNKEKNATAPTLLTVLCIEWST